MYLVAGKNNATEEWASIAAFDSELIAQAVFWSISHNFSHTPFRLIDTDDEDPPPPVTTGVWRDYVHYILINQVQS